MLWRAMLADTALMAFPAELHLYLFMIGVRSGFQGYGIGHRLMAPVPQRYNILSLSVSLESSNPDNYCFHAGHGFATRVVLTPLQGRPPIRLCGASFGQELERAKEPDHL